MAGWVGIYAAGPLRQPAASLAGPPASQDTVDASVDITGVSRCGAHLTLRWAGKLRAEAVKPGVQYAFHEVSGRPTAVVLETEDCPPTRITYQVNPQATIFASLLYQPQGSPAAFIFGTQDIAGCTITPGGDRLSVAIGLTTQQGPGNAVTPPFALTDRDFQRGFVRQFTIVSEQPVCASAYRLTAKVTLRYKAEEASVHIISPVPGDQVVFQSGKLTIQAEARVEPATYAAETEWEVEDISGSVMTIQPEKGSRVTITFKDLPPSNEEFGPKRITAKVRGKVDTVLIKVYFARDGKDNPGRKDPNWFYYWRQGVVAGLERFIYAKGGSYYDKVTGELAVSDEAPGSLPGGYVPLKGTVRMRDGAVCKVKAQIIVTATKGVDSTARVVAHELEHERLYRMIKGGASDADGDGVPTALEKSSPYCLDPRQSNTHALNVRDGTPGDSEALAIAAETRSKSRVKHNLDWASPGSQAK